MWPGQCRCDSDRSLPEERSCPPHSDSQGSLTTGGFPRTGLRPRALPVSPAAPEAGFARPGSSTRRVPASEAEGCRCESCPGHRVRGAAGLPSGMDQEPISGLISRTGGCDSHSRFPRVCRRGQTVRPAKPEFGGSNPPARSGGVVQRPGHRLVTAEIAGSNPATLVERENEGRRRPDLAPCGRFVPAARRPSFSLSTRRVAAGRPAAGPCDRRIA